MRRRNLAVAVLAAAGLGGCTKAEDVAAPPTATPTATPAGAKLVEPATAPRNSPERTVLGYIRYVQLNTTPLALDLYHPVVLDTLTPRIIVEALGSQVGAVQAATVDDVSSERTRRGMLVTFTLRGSEASSRYSVVLRESRGRWAIVYDTLLAGGLSFFAAGPKGNQPLSQKAAKSALSAYGTVLLKIGPTPETARRVPAPTATATPTPTP